jgi:hypothetical protein
MPAPTRHLDLPHAKPLLSIILHREGLLNDKQLEIALREWRRRKVEERYCPFGEVVLKLGLVKLKDLKPCLTLQRKLATPPESKTRLGLLLLQNNLIRPLTLLGALKQQEVTGQRLGEILIEWGLLNRRQIEIALRFQGVNMLAS